jgi:hypothetical protein
VYKEAPGFHIWPPCPCESEREGERDASACIWRHLGPVGTTYHTSTMYVSQTHVTITTRQYKTDTQAAAAPSLVPFVEGYLKNIAVRATSYF